MDAVEGDDDFPDGVILYIATNHPEHNHTPPENKWLMEMSELLSTGLPPPRIRMDEKKILALRSRNFCMVEETL